MKASWPRLLLPLGIVLLAFLLRLHRLGEQNVWWDEALAIWAVRQGLLEATLWTAGDVHPPLYFWALWPWVRLAGEGELAARYLSLLFGVLTVAALYPFGLRLVGARAALLGAALLASARFHVWWSQEMRMYVLAGLLGLVSLHLTLRLVGEGRAGGTRLLVGYVLATAGALLTVYLSALLVAAQSLYVLGAGLGAAPGERWRLWRRWALAQLAVAAILAPWLALALPRMPSWSVLEAPSSLAFVLRLHATLLTLGISTHLERYTPLVLLLLALAALPLLWRGPRRALALPLLLVLLAPLAVWLATQPRALFYTPRVEARYLLPFAPAFYLLPGAGLLLLARRSRAAGLAGVALALGASAWSLQGYYQSRQLRDELHSLAASLAAYTREEDAVVLVSGDRYPLFAYYHGQPAGRGGGALPPVYRLPAAAPRATAELAAAELGEVLARHPRVWLASVEVAIQDPQGHYEAWLDGHLPLVWARAYGHNRLKLYDPAGEPPAVPAQRLPPQIPAAVPLGPGLQLLGADLPIRRFRPGQEAQLALYLDATSPASLSVQLQDGTGRPLQEHRLRVEPRAGGYERMELALPLGEWMPSGRLTLVARSGQAAAPVAALELSHTRPLPAPGRPAHALRARLGTGIRLLGYDLRPAGRALRPGEALVLDLYWLAEEPPEESYTVFTHLLGPVHNPATGGPVWAQHDGPPLQGSLPTHLWPLGTVILDRHVLPLSAQAPPGRYELEVGLYLLASGQRLPVTLDGGEPAGERVLLGSLEVR